jgi:hypothetical protein
MMANSLLGVLAFISGKTRPETQHDSLFRPSPQRISENHSPRRSRAIDTNASGSEAQRFNGRHEFSVGYEDPMQVESAWLKKLAQRRMSLIPNELNLILSASIPRICY